MKNWPTRQLGSFCRTGSGGTPSRKKLEYFDGGTVPWVKSGELKETIVLNTAEKVTLAATKETNAHIIPKNAVLVAMYGATVGETAILGIEAATNQAVCHIIPDPNTAHFRFVWYVLKSRLDELLSKRVGGAQPNISQGIIRDTIVPVPPLAEQERIVKLLDETDKLRKLRTQADRRADELMPALFHQLFEAHESIKGWRMCRLVELCNSPGDIRCGPFGTQLHHSEYQSSGVPLWNIKHVNSHFAFPANEFLTNAKAADLSNYSLFPGDIVMTRKATVGNCSVYPNHFEPGVMHSDLLRIRVNQALCTPDFLSFALAFSAEVKQQVDSVSAGAITKGINVSMLKTISIHLPPLALQKEFAQRVTEIRELEAGQATSRTHLDALFQSMLHRAFNGEL